MTKRATVIVALVAIVWVWPYPADAGDLPAAKALYASASYEEALARLGPAGADQEAVVEANQLRALCLLALGRTTEAESAVERILLHDPAYVVPAAEVSPKLVALFNDVRRRSLPLLARAAYERGKAHVEARHWTRAASEFERMMSLLADPAIASEQGDGLGDLRQLGRGFLTLSQLEIGGGRSEASPSQADRSESDGGRPKSPAQPVETPALSRASGAASVPAGPESAPPITGAGAEPDRQESVTAAPRGDQTERPSAGVATDGEAHADAVATRVGPPAYSALDEGVSPPVEILRRMPRWSPGGRITQTRTTLTGLLEILIDERGTVESASIVRSVTPTYDEVLVQAALGWRFGPAKKAGQAVRYRQVLEIVLRPTRVD